MREVGRAVDGIENPEMARGWTRGARSAELLAKHVVIGVPRGHQLAERAFDREVDLRDEIDHAFLAYAEPTSDRLQLHSAGEPHGL